MGKKHLHENKGMKTPMHKYKLTDETKKLEDGTILHRIIATMDIRIDVHKGDLGGWVKDIRNLNRSPESNAWVYDNAMVYDDSYVTGSAKIKHNAVIKCGSVISGTSVIKDNAIVNCCNIRGHCHIYENTMLDECEFSNIHIYGKNINMSGFRLDDGGTIYSKKDYGAFHNTWSSHRTFFYTNSNKRWRVGCFRGTGWELIRKAFKDSFKSGWNYMTVVLYVRANYEGYKRNFLEKFFYKKLQKHNQLKFEIL